MTFGENLIRLRRQQGLSQEQLGMRIGVSRQTVSKWELNDTTPEMEKLFGDCFETHDQKEGMACFLSREKPKPKAVFTNN